MRFDFPEPFGPIRTFNDCNSSSGDSGPKDRMFRALMVLRNRLSPTMNHHSTRVREQRLDSPDPTHCPQFAVKDLAPETGACRGDPECPPKQFRGLLREDSLAVTWPKNAHVADLPGFPTLSMDYSP